MSGEIDELVKTTLVVFVRMVAAHSRRFCWDLNPTHEDQMDGFHKFLCISLQQWKQVLEKIGYKGKIVKKGREELAKCFSSSSIKVESNGMDHEHTDRATKNRIRDSRHYIVLGQLDGINRPKDQYDKRNKYTPPALNPDLVPKIRLTTDESTRRDTIVFHSQPSPVNEMEESESEDDSDYEEEEVVTVQKLEEWFADAVVEIGLKDDRRNRNAVIKLVRSHVKAMSDLMLANQEDEDEDRNFFIASDIVLESRADEEVVETVEEEEAEDDESMNTGGIEEILSKFTRRSRSLTVNCQNNTKKLIICRPNSSSIEGFEREAKRSKWIEEMLPNDLYRRAFLKYMITKHPDDWSHVADVYQSSFKKRLSTYTTLAFQKTAGIIDKKLAACRSFLSNTQSMFLELKKDVLDTIDAAVGNIPENNPTFGEFALDLKDKELEYCKYWKANIEEDLMNEIELHYYRLLLDHKRSGKIFKPESIEYDPKGFKDAEGNQKRGITILYGGDHGAGYFRMHLRAHFSSPEYRKKIEDMSHRCPLLQIGAIKCKKDVYELLETTIMDTINQFHRKLQKSVVILTYNPDDPKECKAMLLPRSTDFGSITVPDTEGRVHYEFINENGARERTYYQIPKAKQPKVEDAPKYAKIVAISAFQAFLIGDLAFSNMMIGQNNSSGYHCPNCELNGREFGEEGIQKVFRTIESNRQRFLMCQECGGRDAVKGVNSDFLLEIEPSHVLTPILHCPMGLVDKLLEVTVLWVYTDIIKLDTKGTQLRDDYAKKIAEEEEAQSVYANFPEDTRRTPQFAEKEAAWKAYQAKKRSRVTAGKAWNKYLSDSKTDVSGFYTKYEGIFRALNISREHYHGGKFNGVMTIKILENAKRITDDLCDILVQMKKDDVSAVALAAKCAKLEHMLGLLDAIWSMVRGIDGHLPSEEHLAKLRDAIVKGKEVWLEMDLQTRQPKWHLTFDLDHLYKQVVEFGGLADKTDEHIEKAHQYWKKWEAQFCRIAEFVAQQKFIRKAERRTHYPKVEEEVEKLKAAQRTQSDKTERSRRAEIREQEKKAEKEKRRRDYIYGPAPVKELKEIVEVDNA